MLYSLYDENGLNTIMIEVTVQTVSVVINIPLFLHRNWDRTDADNFHMYKNILMHKKILLLLF